ncbi:MAG: YdiU family protein, partial [Actinomycetota bacterium]|nr:YdiU family protein [Actinomycetota bacterium]
MDLIDQPLEFVPLEGLRFDNRFSSQLPADPEIENKVRQVQRSFFSRVHPTRTANPKLLATSKEVLDMVGISEAEASSEYFSQVFSGNALTDGMDPHAACYGGHQFGNWAGQLGDGRAINLGEVLGTEGDHLMLQLKGAGRTPYSRSGDGRAVLRSSIREFLCSEAMYHLGVPTTRALSLCTTGDQVMRDMFYDGNPAYETGAVVCRVAPSFIRFGNFEIFTSRGQIEELESLLQFVIENYYPHLGEPSPETYVEFFRRVVDATAEMIAHWQRVGYVHGVMNTDNMSIHGLTIDYGPYGWIDNFDADWTPNTTDRAHKRYRFGNQPAVAHWNLAQLANALVPAVHEVDPLQAALDEFMPSFNSYWAEMMASKLGLASLASDPADELVAELFDLLHATETDMTIFFRRLVDIDISTEPELATVETILPLEEAYYVPSDFHGNSQGRLLSWVKNYLHVSQLSGVEAAERSSMMKAANPKFVLRNYLAQLVIDAAENEDISMIHEVLDVLRNPYDEQPDYDHWAA